MDYRLARCCNPQAGDEIVGFLKEDGEVFSVHRRNCANLQKIEPSRLVSLCWSEIWPRLPRGKTEIPAALIAALDRTDLAILSHHRLMGVDYAAVVAKATRLPRAEVFARHRKLRELGLLRRVEPRMIRYRQGIVDGKWIKHRNHTYCELTLLGRRLLDSNAPKSPE